MQSWHGTTQSDPERWWLKKSTIQSEEGRGRVTFPYWRLGTILLVIGTVALLIGLCVRVYGENKSDHAEQDLDSVNALKLARTATDIYMLGIILMLVGLALIAWFPASTRGLSR